MVVCNPTLVGLLVGKGEGRKKALGIDEMELLCSNVVSVVWLEYVDAIDVVIMAGKLDGLLEVILLEEIGFDELNSVDIDSDEVGTLVMALVD